MFDVKCQKLPHPATQYVSPDVHCYIMPTIADDFQWELHFSATLIPRQLAFLGLRPGWKRVINFEPNERKTTVFTEHNTTEK
jgi:hypothetical protein